MAPTPAPAHRPPPQMVSTSPCRRRSSRTESAQTPAKTTRLPPSAAQGPSVRGNDTAGSAGNASHHALPQAAAVAPTTKKPSVSSMRPLPPPTV